MCVPITSVPPIPRWNKIVHNNISNTFKYWLVLRLRDNDTITFFRCMNVKFGSLPSHSMIVVWPMERMQCTDLNVYAMFESFKWKSNGIIRLYHGFADHSAILTWCWCFFFTWSFFFHSLIQKHWNSNVWILKITAEK